MDAPAGRQRYWDGSAWTEAWKRATGPTTTPTETEPVDAVMSEPLGTGPVVEPFHKRHARWLIGWGTAALLFVFIGTGSLLGDETDNSLGNSSSTGTSVDDKYEQTWPKSYSSTTCHEWNAEMSADQRWAAAADMLTGARNKGDGGQGVPPDSLVVEFMGGVTRACVVPDMSLAETGAVLYLTERARFRP